MRERRRSFSVRRRDGGRVVAEDEVEVVWFGSSRRVRDLLGLEQHEDLCADVHAINATRLSAAARHRRDVVPMTPSSRQDQPRRHRTRRGKADLERRAICSLLGAVDADLDGLAERRADLQVHPRQRGRLERRRGVAEERGQPVQRYCFGDCSSACGVDFCVDYCFDFSSGECCHLSALALCLQRMSFLRLSPRDGARFAAGFARCGCGLRSLDFCEFWVPSQD